MTQALLIELLTEELPPKALNRLSLAFSEGIVKGLEKYGLIANARVESFATPRRLAVRIADVLSQASDQSFTEKLMPVSVGLNEHGEPTPALLKKLASKGLSHLNVSDLVREFDGKQDYLLAQGISKGAVLDCVINDIIETSLSALPIPKMMRYQLADAKTTVRFVRPVHGLTVLHGKRLLPATVLGVSSKNETLGHRFLSEGAVKISEADLYEKELSKAYVIASYQERRSKILELLHDQASSLGLNIGQNEEVEDLLDEVTALVEYPAVYQGQFEPRFLNVPPECLILTMRLNQKYFPLFDAEGKLSHTFLIVSNMPIKNPHHIIEGNERVVRPRLADAEFFFETDRKIRLEDRLEGLKSIVYHNKLGSQYQRVERLEAISQYLAQLWGSDSTLAQRTP